MNCPHCHQPLPDPAAATCPHCGEPLHIAAQEDPLAGPTVLQGPDEGPTIVPTILQAPDETPTIVPTVLQGSPDAEPERPTWNQPPESDLGATDATSDDGDTTRPDWNQPLADTPVAATDSADSADTVAYTPPSDEAPPPAYTPPAYTPPVELPAMYTPPDVTPPPPPVAPAYTPPQEPLYISPAADQLPETVAYTPPTPQPPAEQPPAYTPPAYTPPAPAYAPPQQPAYQTGHPAATTGQPWTGQAPTPQKKSRAGCAIGCLLALVVVVGLVGGGLVFLKNQAHGITVAGLTIGGANIGPGGGALIYQDALNGSTKSEWTGDKNCFFGSGGYHIKASFICYAPVDKVGDAETTVLAKQLSGPITYGYGLVVRRVSKGNYYTFEINANGKWRFAKVVNGTSTDISAFASNATIKTGLNQANTISVQAKGSHFVFSVNGKQVGAADDSTFTSGDIGLVGNDGIEIVFSDLSIEHLKS